jgi:uncharacterized protein (TIGR03437 family)
MKTTMTHCNRIWILLGLSVCYAFADTVQYTYDDAGRLIRAGYANGSVITYTYDKAGNLLSRVVGAGAGPAISAVVNGASFASGSIAPGEIATIFGTDLTSSTGINLTSGLPLPNEFLKASVSVNGTPAPLFAIDNVNGQQQINFQVPWEVAGKPNATITVTANSATSAGFVVPVKAAQPGIIAYSVGGNTFGVILHANFQLADSAHPVTPGEIVLIYCTGLGAVNSTPADGAAASGETTIAKPTVSIGGLNGSVSFSGLAPSFVGLNQVNVQIPAGVKSGNQPVTLSISGASSNSVLVPVK